MSGHIAIKRMIVIVREATDAMAERKAAKRQQILLQRRKLVWGPRSCVVLAVKILVELANGEVTLAGEV